MSDSRNINAWMGHCGGTDPYCKQGCTPVCANYTYMTGIESTCRDGQNTTVNGDFVVLDADVEKHQTQQETIQRAMQKVRKGPVPTKTRISPLSQHHSSSEQTIVSEMAPRTKDSSVIASTPLATGDENTHSSNEISLTMQTVSSSLDNTVGEEDDELDAEYEEDEVQKSNWTVEPRQPPEPVQQRASWIPPA
jgi:hypothetical protein